MPFTSGELSRLLDPYQLPHGDSRFDGRAFQRKRDLWRGGSALATGALAVGQYAYRKMGFSNVNIMTPDRTNRSGKRGQKKWGRGVRPTTMAEWQAVQRGGPNRWVAGVPVNSIGAPIVETKSVSTNTTMNKSGRREALVPSSLDEKERPMKLMRPVGVNPRIKSVWSSLRELVSGKKVLKNNFSFKLSSSQDKRGLMAIPIRHDANMANKQNDGDWFIGTQSLEVTAAAAGFNEYSTMMLPNNALSLNGTSAPAWGPRGVIIPRMNLPSLEQTSWDLNQLKLVPKNLQDVSKAATGVDFPKHAIMQTVQQLAGSGVPVDEDGDSTYDRGQPAANQSFARKQDQGTLNNFPGGKTVSSFPQFKTQLGGGSLKMRVCNQGTNKITVEFVVLKVTNPYLGAVQSEPDPAGAYAPLAGSSGAANCTRIWEQIWRLVGYEHARKVTKNVSYGMGRNVKTTTELMTEVVGSPYHSWLPQSLFKANYPQFWNQDTSLPLPSNSTNLAPTDGAGLSATTYQNNADDFATDYQIANDANSFNPANNPIGQPGTEGVAGQLGQKSPYRAVSRGHATISGAAERTITIPIPGSCYNASRIESYATNITAGKIQDGYRMAQMSNESYIVLMSLNGSLQDIIEPNSLDDTVKVIGKAYTAAKADVYCQYMETVYPSVCDYSEITPVAYNLGSVRGAQLDGSADAYPGKILAMAQAIPTVTTGVLRTGAADRGGSNDGA